MILRKQQLTWILWLGIAVIIVGLLVKQRSSRMAETDSEVKVLTPSTRNFPRITQGRNKRSGRRITPPTFHGNDSRNAWQVDQLIEQLKAGLDTDQFGRKQATLFGFWEAFDRASPADKPAFRAALPILIDEWRRGPPQLKPILLSAFDRLTPPTEEVVDIYIEALGDSSLAQTATAALMRSGPMAAKATPALMDQLQSNFKINDSGERSSSTARMSLEALANIGPGASAATELVRSYLTDESLMYRVFGARAYWKITGDASPVLPVLVAALSKENSFWAADILKEMGPAAASAVPTLRETYRIGSPDVRLRSYQALMDLDRHNLPDSQGVADLLQTPNPITRIGAAEILWNLNHDPEQILPHLMEIANRETHEHNLISIQLKDVIRICGEIGPAAAEALPVLQRVLESRTGSSINRIVASNAWLRINPEAPVPSVREN